MDVPALRRRLLAWYDRGARDLPWRRTRDPYAIWVSEVMLQQTRVEAAKPYYARWMATFPTVESLAAADPDRVLASWSGLGYYARARRLHEAARELVARHGGRLPRTEGGLRRLPGFGPYTAAAVASIAFGQPAAAVDGNVVRVVARLRRLRGTVDGPAARRRIAAEARALLAPRRPGDWNQALMDLGATVCRPRRPLCGSCPVASLCRARASGDAGRIPARRRRAPPRREALRYGLLERGGRLLLVRNAAHGRFGGLWRLPGGDGADLPAAVLAQTGLRVRAAGPLASVRSELTHRTLLVEVVRLHCRRPAQALADGARWVALDELGSWPVATSMRKAIAAAGFGAASGRAIGKARVRRA